MCGEVRGVHGWTQRSVVSALDTERWPEDGREHVGDEIRGVRAGDLRAVATRLGGERGRVGGVARLTEHP